MGLKEIISSIIVLVPQDFYKLFDIFLIYTTLKKEIPLLVMKVNLRQIYSFHTLVLPKVSNLETFVGIKRQVRIHKKFYPIVPEQQ